MVLGLLLPTVKKGAATRRQSRTELLKTAVVDRAIRAPSNESNRETGPTPEITSCHGFVGIDVKTYVIHNR